MAGLCGSIGVKDHDIVPICKALSYTGREQYTTYTENSVNFGYVDHPIEYHSQPTTASDGEVLIWIWGDVIGHEYKGTYTKKPADSSKAGYCATLFEKYGDTFVHGLNSDFSGVVYDKSREVFLLFTDRLGARSIYYTQSDEKFLFSTGLQSLGADPKFQLEVNPNTLPTYLRHGITPGTSTIAKNVQTVSPGSVLMIDLSGSIEDKWTYWWPNPSPKNYSIESYISMFADVISDAVRDREHEDLNTGLLLSAGTDSKAILAAVESGVTCFHMNESIDSGEAQRARATANVAGEDFKFLQRDLSYYPRVLEEISEVTNLNGAFYRAHAKGFEDEITSQVDVLISGTFSDATIGGMYIPTSTPTYSILKHIHPSVESRKDIKSPSEFIESFESDKMWGFPGSLSYTTGLISSEEALNTAIAERKNDIVMAGVPYPSLKSLVDFGRVYPITQGQGALENADFIPTYYPYLDNRVIDLVLEMPISCNYRSHIVDMAIPKIDSTLSEFPYDLFSEVGPTTYALIFQMDRISKGLGRLNKHFNNKDQMVEGPWPDHDDLIRSHPFIKNKLEKNKKDIKKSPYLSYDDLHKYYQNFIKNGGRRGGLYLPLTLLESSLSLSQEIDQNE